MIGRQWSAKENKFLKMETIFNESAVQLQQQVQVQLVWFDVHS